MEDHAVPVLGVGENAPTAEREAPAAFSPIHSNLKATVIARTVIAKLTQGPQSITPAMTAIAKRGQNDLPNTSRVCDRNLRGRRLRVRSFPSRFRFAVQGISGRKELPAPRDWDLESGSKFPSRKLYSLRVFRAIGRIDRPLRSAKIEADRSSTDRSG
jgi:hypothetical protein